MDKYAVETDPEAVKTASESKEPSCPSCGSSLTPGANVPRCPQCGTKPFEAKRAP
jgi:tRNA(Ile2) C34 agmatinyltransferase TiaS